LNELPRGWVWLHLAVAWLPMWALFTALIMSAHDLPVAPAAIGSLRMIVPGAALGVAVYRFTLRTPWPHPFRLRFLGLHLVAALVYSGVWFALVVAIDSLVAHHVTLSGPGPAAFLIVGVWLYLVVAGVAYANRAAQRAAQLEAYAARGQLAQLRAQLHPHFLFNTLHTIVHLIPTAPRDASRAAEKLADALRAVIEEDRDALPLADELAFVERYLDIERVRFGDRLRVDRDVDAAALPALVPSFAVQTLVENAVRHGAAPNVGATTIRILARATKTTLTLDVYDDGAGAHPDDVANASGTGIRRLRERLRWTFGERARLDVAGAPGAGFRATLVLPLVVDVDALERA
jgi:hypothetical protein